MDTYDTGLFNSIKNQCEQENIFKTLKWTRLQLFAALLQQFEETDINITAIVTNNSLRMACRDNKSFTCFVTINSEVTEMYIVTLTSTYNLSTTNNALILSAVDFALKERINNNEAFGGNPHTLH